MVGTKGEYINLLSAYSKLDYPMKYVLSFSPRLISFRKAIWPCFGSIDVIVT